MNKIVNSVLTAVENVSGTFIFGDVTETREQGDNDY
jgi:hypothetical protein